MRRRYRKMEDQKSGSGAACRPNLDFAEGKGLEPKSLKKFPKLSKLEDVVSKLA